VELARQTSGGVLELACGTGQLTVPIATAGFPTVGLDLSAYMLTTARERAATANVSVEYVLADIRNFDLGRKFALIQLSVALAFDRRSFGRLRGRRLGGTWRLEGSGEATVPTRAWNLR
jgi:SAM-dependent methyltransferase